MSEKVRGFCRGRFELCRVVQQTFANHATIDLVEIAHSGRKRLPNSRMWTWSCWI